VYCAEVKLRKAIYKISIRRYISFGNLTLGKTIGTKYKMNNLYSVPFQKASSNKDRSFLANSFGICFVTLQILLEIWAMSDLENLIRNGPDFQSVI